MKLKMQKKSVNYQDPIFKYEFASVTDALIEGWAFDIEFIFM